MAEVENGEAPQKEAAQKAGVTQTANAEALQRAEVLRDRAREELWKGAVSGAKRDSDKLTASFAAKWNEGASAELAALRLSNPNPNPSPTPDPDPDPNPSPSPRPRPSPSPSPSPSPHPSPSPSPNPSRTRTLASP